MGAVGGSTLRSGQPVTVVLTNQWIWTVCVASTCSFDAHWYYYSLPSPHPWPSRQEQWCSQRCKVLPSARTSMVCLSEETRSPSSPLLQLLASPSS